MAGPELRVDPGRVIAAARTLVRLLGAPEPRFHFES